MTEFENSKSTFETLSEKDLTAFHKRKQNITYLPWSAAWREVKRSYPDAHFRTIKDEHNNLYHTDGKTCWVEVEVEIEGETQTETLAVMDHRNNAVPLENVQMTAVCNSIKRCLVKCLALFGLDLNLWEGEELSVTAKEVKKKEEEKEAELSALKQKIAQTGAQLIQGGVSKDNVYDKIEEISGGKNPNNIHDKEIAEQVLAALKDMKSDREDEE